MNPDRWQEIVVLYQAAVERSTAVRKAFLAEACQSDEELRREVQSLLDQDVSLEGPLERIARDSALWDAAEDAPRSIGPFRIQGLIGEGGMGAVYRAEQDNPQRAVALKLLKPGFSTSEGFRRFEQESHVLAAISHEREVCTEGFEG